MKKRFCVMRQNQSNLEFGQAALPSPFPSDQAPRYSSPYRTERYGECDGKAAYQKPLISPRTLWLASIFWDHRTVLGDHSTQQYASTIEGTNRGGNAPNLYQKPFQIFYKNSGSTNAFTKVPTEYLLMLNLVPSVLKLKIEFVDQVKCPHY